MKVLKKLTALVLAGVIGLSTLTGCGIDPEQTAATLGEETVSLGFVNFMAKYQKATMDDTYAMYAKYFGVKDIWNADLYGTGSTTKDNLMTSIMSYLHDLYTLKAHMSDYKVALTADDEKKIKDAATAFMTGNSEEAIKEFGATQEYVEQLLTLYTIEYYMFDAITADTDREVSDKEANMRGFSYIQISTDVKDEELEKITANVNKIIDAVKGGKKLEDAVKEYKYTVKEAAYSTFEDDSSMDKTLLKELKKLKEGETSGIIKGEDYIYVARIDADTDKEATEDNREAIISEREAEDYEEVMKKWQKEDGWKVDEKAVAKIDFHHMFTQDDGSTESEKESGSEKTSEKESGSEKTSEKETSTEKSTDK